MFLLNINKENYSFHLSFIISFSVHKNRFEFRIMFTLPELCSKFEIFHPNFKIIFGNFGEYEESTIGDSAIVS